MQLAHREGVLHGAAIVHMRDVLASELCSACRYYSIEFELLEVSGKTVMGATYMQVSVFRARWQGDWCWVGSGGGSCNWRSLLDRRQQTGGFSLSAAALRGKPGLSNKNARGYGKRGVLLQ